MCTHPYITTVESDVRYSDGTKVLHIKLRCDTCWVERRILESDFRMVMANLLNGDYAKTVVK